MLFTSSLLTFSPDVEKLKFLNQKHEFDYVRINESIDDIKGIYYLQNNQVNYFDKLKSSLMALSESKSNDEVNVSAEVLNQSIKVLESLYPSFYEKLSDNDIYPSNYGTIIFDWEKSADEIFSLEIGKNSLGYFIEKNEVDEKQVESLSLDNNKFESSMKNLLTDLSVFI